MALQIHSLLATLPPHPLSAFGMNPEMKIDRYASAAREISSVSFILLQPINVEWNMKYKHFLTHTFSIAFFALTSNDASRLSCWGWGRLLNPGSAGWSLWWWFCSWWTLLGCPGCRSSSTFGSGPATTSAPWAWSRCRTTGLSWHGFSGGWSSTWSLDYYRFSGLSLFIGSWRSQSWWWLKHRGITAWANNLYNAYIGDSTTLIKLLSCLPLLQITTTNINFGKIAVYGMERPIFWTYPYSRVVLQDRI